jgi:hypothetical protein
MFGAGAVYRFAPVTQTGTGCAGAAVPSATGSETVVLALLLGALGLALGKAGRGRRSAPQ